MSNKEVTNEYLNEDQDILSELDKTDRHWINEDIQIHLSKLQIKATLRSRKTMVDLDSSNKRFSYIFFFFAIVQVVIAVFQFVADMSEISENKLAGAAFVVLLLGGIFWIGNKFIHIINGKE